MKIAVLGTGMVGEALASRLAELGHDVMMGARERDNKRALAWAEGQGARSAGDFAAAAAFAEVVFIAVRGTASRDAAEQAGPAALAGKIVVDVTNPLIFDAGLAHLDPDSVNTISSVERLQQVIPDSRLVVLPDCGHVPQEERSELFAELVSDFIYGEKGSVSDDVFLELS